MAWWEGSGADRLARDQQIVAAGQPGLHFKEHSDELMTLVGDFVVVTGSGKQHLIPTTLLFPPDYPEHEPTAFETSGRFPHEIDRHFFENGGCCLWLHVESLWHPEDPAGLQVVLDQLGIFYHRQLMIEAGVVKSFPGPQRGHGGHGYADYLKEAWLVDDAWLRRMRFALAAKQEPKSACPCGSGKQYRRCHQGTITRFRQKAYRPTLDHLIEVLAGMPSGNFERRD